MTPEEEIALLKTQVELLNDTMMRRISRDLAFDALELALVETHPDRQALFAAFEKRAKALDDAYTDKLNPKAMERMRLLFDRAYGQIVTVIRSPGEAKR